jgi:N-hydroxyarylamine O-acetyltransferase
MHDTVGHLLDLDAYRARLRYFGEIQPDAATLCALHLAHITSIPFENVNPQLGRPVPLDVPSLETKLVRDLRGGYCFEQNGLFAAVLEELGFNLTRLAARVRLGATRVLPRTHMLLLVECEGVSWICDVGFGGWGLLEPLPLEPGREVQHGAWTMRLLGDEEYWVLLCLDCPAGPDLYAFTLEPQQPIDYEPANHYCATHPNSRFVQTFTVQLPRSSARTILRGRELTVFEPSGAMHTTVFHGDELFQEIEARFGLALTPAERAELSRKIPDQGPSMPHASAR